MIYLHHYPASMFSEKIRLLLGHYGLEWHSVEIPGIMPRPLLMPLSGGYRRAPVLQIGANVYSDTKIICKALARHVGDDTLYAHGFPAHRVADWADTELFRIAVALNFRPEALAVMMSRFSEAEAAAFAKDRAELAGDQPIVTLSPAGAMSWLDHALMELDDTLGAGQAFLFGADPSIADFSVYHNFWFLRNNSVNAPLLESYPHAFNWYERMSAIGHGHAVASDGDDALAAARAAEPVLPELIPAPLAQFRAGDRVAVKPVDYGRVPVVGRLMAQSQDEIVIQRDTTETGTVFNHFPQAGFEVSAAPE